MLHSLTEIPKKEEIYSTNSVLLVMLLKEMIKLHLLHHSGNISNIFLRGVVGRKSGSTAFPYSKSMKTIGFTWTEKHLFAFLKSPSRYVVGTKMAFAGIENEQERADLIAYLGNN